MHVNMSFLLLSKAGVGFKWRDVASSYGQFHFMIIAKTNNNDDSYSYLYLLLDLNQL